MNFPGLDSAWTLAYRFGHALRVVQTWSLDETRAALGEGEKVLVVATTALGDSLLTTPLVQTLSERLGRDRVSLLVKAPYAELYQDDPRVRHVFTVRGKYRWSSLEEKLDADPHGIALLANMTEPDLVPYLWRCGVRGFLRYRSRWTRFPRLDGQHLHAAPARSRRLRHRSRHRQQPRHGRRARARPTTHRLYLPHLHTAPGKRENLVLIHPGASVEFKRWPVENWARLGDALADRFKCAIAITGDRSEHSLAAHIAATMRARPEVLAGKLSLVELARTQGRALAFLSGDTGPYHLAVAVGCPTLTLFAPTDRGSSLEACGPHQAPRTIIAHSRRSSSANRSR
ncbi:MAG: glycosyltransferase family 9 protein [Verrucomicrobiota bacterium]